MSSKSYLIRLEVDQSTIVLPSGKYSGNSRISLSEDQMDKISEYQYSIVRINYYNDKASSQPEEVSEFDQGELRHKPDDNEIPCPDNKNENNNEDDEVKELDSNNEISDNEDDDINYCNVELSNGGYCKREVESEDQTCWQH